MSEKPELKQVETCDHYRCSNPAQAPGPCPYKSEINDDSETLCTCCEDCRHECLMDI